MTYFGIDNNKLELMRLDKIAQKYPIPYISYSQLNTFLQCKESWRLTYRAEKFQRLGNKYTELGSVLHDIFEAQGKALIFDSEKPFTIEQAFKQYNQAFMKIDKAHFTDKEDWVKMYQKGVTAIESYYSVYAEVSPLYVEKQHKVKIGEGIPEVKGFIDRIDGDPDDPSTWIVTDYKTGSSPKDKKYLRKDFQLGLYASQIFAVHGVYPKAVQFFHPVPNKLQTAVHQGDGVYKFQGQRAPVVEFSVADTIITVRETVQEIIKTIEEEGFKKEPESFKCKMCFHYQAGTCKPFDKVQEGWNW
ncbi:double-strand break repair protein [Bacillus phage vB_BpsS-36]|uniref:Double-strand break repair protein n=1 Tax=Bacillus phage vB_BpsS-36 TaxID=2419622 RepID=A0A3G3BX81_9CAUD|nr:double-strand break repair protein [Bacillus phage vB_BpsS-36]